jgi:hypothetical protein
MRLGVAQSRGPASQNGRHLEAATASQYLKKKFSSLACRGSIEKHQAHLHTL